MAWDIIKGPAKVTFAGTYVFFTKGDIRVQHETQTTGIMTDQHGPVDDRFDSMLARITFTPSGRWSECAGLIEEAYARNIGDSLFTGSARALVIEPLNNAQPKTTFHRVALTTLPNVQLAATQTLWESLTFTALRKTDVALNDAAGLFTRASQDSAPALTFDPADVLTLPWTGAWRSDAADPEDDTSWDAFKTMGGFQVQLGMQTSEDKTDHAGLCDMTLTGLTVQVRAAPLVREQTLHEGLRRTDGVMTRGVTLGRDYSLVLRSGVGYTITLPKCGMKDAQSVFGKEAVRQGEVVWMAAKKTGTTALITLTD